ncbi:MAG: hypothetical protein K9K86_03435, partial [Pseudomonadales bacterium]|nr:hypothetical protein [Pseudomonadales bacterium]
NERIYILNRYEIETDKTNFLTIESIMQALRDIPLKVRLVYALLILLAKSSSEYVIYHAA